MSLKADRIVNNTITVFTVDEYAERGELSFLDNEGYTTSTKHSVKHNHKYGYGFLLSDVVSLDIRPKWQYIFTNDEVYSGGKVELVTNGTIIVSTLSPYIKKKVCCGTKLYLSNKGKITLRKTNQFIGTCLSKADDDGFVKMSISTF